MTETYLIVKYGSLNKAYHWFMNNYSSMPSKEFELINEFFADKSLRERLQIG